MSVKLIFETTYNITTGDPKEIISHVYCPVYDGDLFSFTGLGDPFDGNYPDEINVCVLDDREFRLIRVSEDQYPPEYGFLVLYSESGKEEETVPMLFAGTEFGSDEVLFTFGTNAIYPVIATDIPIAMYGIYEKKSSLSKNYNDKDAIKVKNPIADALDRLTAAIDVPSSDGGEPAKDYVKLTLESDLTRASNSALETLSVLFYPGPVLVEAIPVHFAEGYMYGGEYDYNQKTVIIDPLSILLGGGVVECYVDRNVIFMMQAIPEFVEGVTFSSDDAPTEALVGVYVKTEVTGATIDSEGYFNPVASQVTPLIDFSTAEDEVTISLVVISPGGGPT